MHRETNDFALAAIAARFCILSLLLGAIGCGGGPAAIPPVDVNIDQVVQALLSEYDSDGSGGLSRGEMEALPALQGCLSRCRHDRGNEISAEQLKSHLQYVFDRKSSLISANCLVRRNGKPLAGAEVRFVPLPVLQNVLPVGTGVTDSDGTAVISADPSELPSAAGNATGLMRPGLYLVEVTHESINIPEKYNRQTVLGKEISSDAVYRSGLVVDLKL